VLQQLRLFASHDRQLLQQIRFVTGAHCRVTAILPCPHLDSRTRWRISPGQTMITGARMLFRIQASN
jgi:hypothetical protein